MYAEAQEMSTDIRLNPQTTEPLRLDDLIGKITCADCMDILRQLPDKCVDLVLTDPPYFGIVKNDWDNQWKNIFEFQKWVGEVGKEIKRVLKDNGSFYWFGDDKTIAYCQVELDKHFRLLNNIVWKKESLITTRGTSSVFRGFAPITERCLFYDKGEDKTGLEMVKNVMPNPFAKYLKDELLPYFGSVANFRKFVVKEMHLDSAMVNRWFDSDCLMTKDKYLFIREKTGKLRREYEELRREYEELRRVWNNDLKALDVLDFKICVNERIHPTQKPLNLISYLMQRSSNENDLVLDCFSGSGTTAIACHRLNRRFICIEKDKEYWAASCKRLEDERKQLSLFGGNQ
jgi:site-specific DNA-methyltransferase (adenine-specific)